MQRTVNVSACPYLRRFLWASLSALLLVFSKCSHHLCLERNTEAQHLADARLSVPALPATLHPCWLLARLPAAGSHGPRTGRHGVYLASSAAATLAEEPAAPRMLAGHRYVTQSRSSSLRLVLWAILPNSHSISAGAD